MATTLDELESNTNSHAVVETKYVNSDGQPNVALLQDRTPPWLQTSAPVALLTLVLGLSFTLLSYFPLWHTDLWGHLSYARWIIQQGRLPQTEPLLPLAQGMPFVDSAWLSQLIGYFMIERFGVAGIQFLSAVCIVGTGALLTFAVYRRVHRASFALLTLFAFYWTAEQQLEVVRPQLAGMLCFAAVFVLATSPAWKRWFTWVIPVIFAFWANLHGSFIVGLTMLAALTVGRALDVWRRSGNWKVVLSERGFRQLLFTTELSAAAVLLNPYGLAIYPEVLSFGSNPNLTSLTEWDPLTLRMPQGQAAACLAFVLVVLYKLTPRRITFREVLLLCGLGCSMMWHSRMIVWWAPVAAYYFGIHAAAVWRHYRKRQTVSPQRKGLWTVVALGLLWICFAYTPFGFVLLHGRPQDAAVAEKRFRKSVSSQTPIDVTEYLKRNPPQGQIFNTYEWGDYLLWAGPPGLKVYVNSFAHVVPEEVWQDYFVISQGEQGWEDKLDRYGINAVVVDHADRGELIKAMEKLPSWEQKYSDRNGSVFYRKKPI